MNFLCAPVVWQVPCRGVRGVAVWALTQGHRTRTAPSAWCLERRLAAHAPDLLGLRQGGGAGAIAERKNILEGGAA